MTNQEIFDKVATHLLSQGKRSALGGVGCAYRGDGGLQCAIGCLIPDELYRYELEGWGAAFCTVGAVVAKLIDRLLVWL